MHEVGPELTQVTSGLIKEILALGPRILPADLPLSCS